MSRGGVHDGLVEVERLGPRREHLVLGRGGEGHALGLDVRLPAPPGLQRDVVPARGERAAERDHREGVTRVAEGAQQDAHRRTGGRVQRLPGGRGSAGELGEQPQLLEALGAVNAVGVTPSVPTPASR